MELEPDFSRLSFDMDFTELDRQPQGSSLLIVNHPRSFNGASQVGTTSTDLLSANDNHADFSSGADLTLFELPSFFEMDCLSANNLKSTAEMYWQGVEHNLCSLYFDPRTELNLDGHESYATNASLQHCLDLGFDNKHSLPETNGHLDITQSEFAQEQNCFPRSPSQRGRQIADPQLPFISQDISDEYDPTGLLSYIYSTEHDNLTNLAPNIPPSGTTDAMVGSYYLRDHGDTGGVPNLCIRPEVLTLTPSCQTPLSPPNDQDSQATDHHHELITSINIDTCQDLTSSRPVPIFNDLIFNFDLKAKPAPSKRKRSSFTKAGKEKVSLVRDWGACIFCRSRKVSVSDTLSPTTT